MQDFKKLKVWEKSHQLALDIYKVTKLFPKEELYGLTSQLRRSSTSIPANIAEGCGRGGKFEFSRFLRISLGSATELEYHLILAQDLKFIKIKEYQQLSNETTEVKKMLTSLIQKLKSPDH